MRLALACVAAGAVLAVAPSVAPSAAAADGVAQDCSAIPAQADGTRYATDQPSLPLREMGVDDALARLRKQHVKPGEGVTVAVIDSGVSSRAPVTFAGHVEAGNKVPEPSDYHGTAVAGLIAGAPRTKADGGLVGIAPAARIFDVQVYDEAGASTAKDSPQSPMTPENLRTGLQAVIDAVPTLGIQIVNMSLAIPSDEAIEAQVAELWRLGVVVVAPTGNRSSEAAIPGLPEEFTDHSAGEDAAPFVHPADFPDVLAVNATPTGSSDLNPTKWVLENSATDVAAPTAGAVSYSLRGESCFLAEPATSYAAAEVSGVLALLQSAYDEPVAASIRRLLTTASGRPDVPNTLVGAGEVQSMDALTRPMEVDGDGTELSAGTVEHQPQVLKVPEEPDDVLASTRENAVWWGLVGGGTLLLAVLLRPVLARRRRTLSR
jgi:membrane-anchored mycosin MYCP